MVECGNCGSALLSVRGNGLFVDGDPITCSRCGTKNQVMLDEEDGDPITCSRCGTKNQVMLDEEDDEAYVGSWVCAHGRNEEQECDDCDDAEVLLAACERRAL